MYIFMDYIIKQNKGGMDGPLFVNTRIAKTWNKE